MEKRLYHYDCMRALGCIFIIGIHTTDSIKPNVIESTWQWEFGDIFQMIFRIGLPLFFMISGALLLNSEKESLKEFYGKRFCKVVIPLFIYSLFYLYTFKYGNSIFNVNILLDASKEILSTYVSGHLWFIYTILGIYLITPFISIMVRKLSDTYIIALIKIIIIVRILNIYLPMMGIRIGIENYLIYGWMDYFIMGYFLTRNISMKYYNKILFLGGISFIVSLVISKYFPNYNQGIYDIAPTMFFIASSLFILFEKNKKIINKEIYFEKIITFISKYSFSIYLIHRYVLDEILAKHGIYAIWNGVIWGTVITISLTLIISTFMAFIIDNILINPIAKFAYKIINYNDRTIIKT